MPSTTARKHYQKSRRECTEYGIRHDKHYRGLFAKTAEPQVVDAFFADPEAFMTQGERLKSGNTCTVQRFQFANRGYVLKRYNLKPLLTRIRRNFKESRAMKSLVECLVPPARKYTHRPSGRGL